MKPKHQAAIFLAIVILPIVIIIFYFVFFGIAETSHSRDNYTTKQQKIIAEALGFDIVPGETLTAKYYYDWPEMLEVTISGIPSEKEFLARCREEALPYWDYREDKGSAEFGIYCMDENSEGNSYSIPKAIEKIIVGNQLPYYLAAFVFYGALIAEPVLVVVFVSVLVSERRRVKKEKPL